MQNHPFFYYHQSSKSLGSTMLKILGENCICTEYIQTFLSCHYYLSSTSHCLPSISPGFSIQVIFKVSADVLRPQLLSRYKKGTKTVVEKTEEFTMDTMSQLYLFWKIITFFAQTMLVCNGLLLFLNFVLISNRTVTNSWHKPKLLGGSQCLEVLVILNSKRHLTLGLLRFLIIKPHYNK